MNGQKVHEVMTREPVTIGTRETLIGAATMMRDYDIGDVIVTDGDRAVGILTDRDIIVRAIAEGRDLTTTVGEVCSQELITVKPDDGTQRVVELMRGKKIRRLPVTDGGKLVGVVSLGDMAVERDPHSALADISSATPNH
ncbi:MAG: CBS domain-containing protein [Hamadaea sp.]|uniref:CBS domain-containing protein n=1 Tax=Hamadaea sp. NPDC050747 TaxID=3155789 RepID=UPI0017C75651|nr:CBS domain-containing protein [Hamadaea sp.]NUR48628.1 CBS domain-containing protein [Hamadaea sp.]NUT04857.1 CBS domain-containing protein [Hamadaea sp.]